MEHRTINKAQRCTLIGWYLHRFRFCWRHMSGSCVARCRWRQGVLDCVVNTWKFWAVMTSHHDNSHGCPWLVYDMPPCWWQSSLLDLNLRNRLDSERKLAENRSRFAWLDFAAVWLQLNRVLDFSKRDIGRCIRISRCMVRMEPTGDGGNGIWIHSRCRYAISLV